MEYKIIEERLTANEYIEFLKHTDLGSQYPKERFEERINTLVNKVSISLVARNVCNEIIGVLTFLALSGIVCLALRGCEC